MENTPLIETENLILRRFTPADAKPLYAILSDEQVNTFLPMFPLKNLDEAELYLKTQYLDKYANPEGYHYAICLKTDRLPIGYINIFDGDSHDLGYGLKKELWHKGIVTEACRALVDRLSRSGLPYITATHDVKNPRSGEVMKKLGMTYRYTYEELWQPKNILVNFRMYQLNLDGNKDRVYMEYWDRYPVHYIEAL